MTITRYDEDTIECLLSPEDLSARHLSLDGLSYNSPVLKSLTADLLRFLRKKYDFNVSENEPVAIEAVPLEDGGLAVIFSRNAYLDDMDPRYSIFSDPDNDDSADTDNEAPATVEDALHRLLDSILRSDTGDSHYLLHRDSTKEESSTTMGIFAFDNFSDVLHLINLLSPSIPMSAGIFRTEKDAYLMIFHFYKMENETMSGLLSIICEYGMIRQMAVGTESYVREHAQMIMPVVPFIILKTLIEAKS